MIRRVRVSVLVCVVSGLLGGRAVAGIVTTTGDIEVLSSPPPFTGNDDLTSDTHAFAFAEVQDFLLPKDLEVNRGSDLKKNTWVSSYFLHADVADESSFKNLVGSITFDTDILGVIFRNTKLKASDGVLGAPGTSYVLGANREMELNEGDEISISDDLRTVSFKFHIKFYRDECRVVTASPVPEPSTFAIWSLIGLFFIAARSYQRRKAA